MPFSEVMKKFSKGLLHSGSKTGPKVKDRKQAIAIRMSEKKKADEGDEEYKPKDKKKGVSSGPSKNFMKKHKLD